MARAKSTESIPPFPADIDRAAFGHWLSGFADGESSFLLFAPRCRPSASQHPGAGFRIGLRADETPILRTIQSYFGCGHLIHNDNARSKITNAKPVAIYHVYDSRLLNAVVIPHFDTYPLRAKKLRDYVIWKQGVALITLVSVRKSIPRRGLGGFHPKWTPEERQHFLNLRLALIEQRRYDANECAPSPTECHSNVMQHLLV